MRQGVQATRSHVSLVSTSISSTGPTLRLLDMSFASLTSSSVISVASGVLCEASCLVAYRTSFKGSLNTAVNASKSFLVLLACLLSKADKLLSACKLCGMVAVECSFFDGRVGIDVNSEASAFLSRCSFANLKETACSSSEGNVTMHECRLSDVPRYALTVMGSANVQTVDCFFENCGSTALVAGLLPSDIENYLKFLWRWKRASSKEKHASITLQLPTLPCRLLLGFAKPFPPNCAVYLLEGGVIESESSVIERNELFAAQDSPAMTVAHEEFVQAELNLQKSNRDKVLMRVISLMAFNSIRVAFDKWSLAVASAAHERMLAEEAAKKAELLASQRHASDSDSDSDDDDEEPQDGREISSLSDSSAAKEYVRFRKKKLRQLEKQRRQVIAMRCAGLIDVH